MGPSSTGLEGSSCPRAANRDVLSMHRLLKSGKPETWYRVSVLKGQDTDWDNRGTWDLPIIEFNLHKWLLYP